jgi:TP901 family phage tail tape measure protein
VAFSARDIFLSVRVIDRATRPLRGISGELRAMQGTSAGVAAQRARVNKELAGISPGGAARQRLLDKQLASHKAIEQSNKRLLSSQAAITTNMANQELHAANLAKQRRIVAALDEAGAPATALVGKGAGARTVEEHRQLLKGMETRALALQRGMTSLARAQLIETGTLDAAHAKLQRNIGDIAAMDQRVAQLTAKEQALARVESAYLSQENTAKWSQRSRTIRHVGNVLTIGGVAATAAFGLAARTAADFRTQTILAATQARPPGAPASATAGIASRLNEVVLKQMRQFPATANEMSQALYSIFSGTNIQQIPRAAQLLKIFNQEAVAGGTSLDTMVQAGISLYNNFPREFRNMTSAGNKFFAMVRYGRGTADQFAAALSPILPIAKQAGQNFDEVSGTLAFLSRQSKDVTQNSQGYARLLLLLARPEVRQGFQKIGVSVTDSRGRIRNLIDIITELKQHLKLTPVEALTFFKTISQQATGRGTAGTIQAQRVFARLYEGLDQYRVVARETTRDNGEFQRSFEALSKSPGVQWKIFTNQLKALVILVGEQAIPAFAKLGQYIGIAVHWFQQLSPHTQHLIGYFGAMVAVGTLVGGVLLAIGGGLASIVFTLRMLAGNKVLAGLAADAERAGGATTAMKGAGAIGLMRASRGRTAASRFGPLSDETGAVTGKMIGLLAVLGPTLYILTQYPGVIGKIINALGGLSNALSLLTASMVANSLAKRGFLGDLAGLSGLAKFTRVGAVAGYIYMLQQISRAEEDAKKHHKTFWGEMAHGLRPTPFFKSMASNFVAAASFGQAHVFQDTDKFKDPVMSTQIFQKQIERLRQQATQISRRTQLPELLATTKLQPIVPKPLKTLVEVRPHMPENAQAMIDRATQMAHLNMHLPVDKLALGDVIRKAALAAVGSLGIRIPAAGDKALKKMQQLEQTATQFGYKKITPNFTTLYNNLIKAKKLLDQAHAALQLSDTPANRRASIAAFANYQKALDALTNGATKTQVAAAKDAANQIDKVEKARITKQKQNLKTAIDNVQSMYDSLLQQNQQLFGTLFQGPFLTSPAEQAKREWGVKTTSRGLLRDLRAQNTQFVRFEGALNRLRRRGAPQQLISQLQQLGPEALPNIQLLTKMQPNQWRQYTRAFREGQNLIKQQTTRDLNAQLALYRRFGKKVGEQIVLGIRDQSTPMRSELRRLVLNMFPELKPGTGRAANRNPSTKPVVHHHVHHHDHDHTKVEVKPGTDVGSALQRDRFRKKHQPKSPRIRR